MLKEKILNKIITGTSAAAVACMFYGMAASANTAGIDTMLPAEYIQYCEETGRKYNICPELLQAVIEAESGGNPDAVGQAGEIGLMQVYPKHHRIRAEHLGIYDLFDPAGNILVGTDYLAELFEAHQDPGTVLMVYNGVEGAAERGKKGDYTEYAEKIMERAACLEREHGK